MTKLLAVGDISLTTGNSRHPFESVTALLSDKDILFGNLEAVLSGREVVVEKSVSLTCDPHRVKYLTQAGFDILSVANNHIMDTGVEGFKDTLANLDGAGLAYVGGRTVKTQMKSVILPRGGLKFGFLGYYQYGTEYDKGSVAINSLNESQICKDMEVLKPECDHIVISLHWGIEKSFYPSPSQVGLAHRLIDSGANLILGHHPHVVQAVEEYKGGLIAYSLGNFQFQFDAAECTGPIDRRTNRAITLAVNFESDGITSFDVIPIGIDSDFVPFVSGPDDTREMIDFVEKVTVPIKEGSMSEMDWHGRIASAYLTENARSFVTRIRRYGGIHIFKFMKWLISPFVVKCYLGYARNRLKGISDRP